MMVSPTALQAASICSSGQKTEHSYPWRRHVLSSWEFPRGPTDGANLGSNGKQPNVMEGDGGLFEERLLQDL